MLAFSQVGLGVERGEIGFVPDVRQDLSRAVGDQVSLTALRGAGVHLGPLVVVREGTAIVPIVSLLQTVDIRHFLQQGLLPEVRPVYFLEKVSSVLSLETVLVGHAEVKALAILEIEPGTVGVIPTLGQAPSLGHLSQRDNSKQTQRGR